MPSLPTHKSGDHFSISETGEARLWSLLGFGLRHWLALYLVLSGLYAGLALLAPVAMSLGWIRLGTALHGLYFWVCHQEPGASYLVFGRGEPLSAELVDDRFWKGSPAIGWKTALCQRNLAIYGSLFLYGLVFGLTGRRWKAPPFWLSVLLMVPMAADGLTQVFGLRESNWLWRTLSGSLFSLGVVWALLPRVQAASREALEQFAANRL
ncbi:MAG: DUF2085 domain-containing protein [Caldilineaceae bacterium]|nr:DUF2085 domain-containing protein [Caldilineaceae bacterium]